MIENKIHVAVVDDDPSYLRALERLLRAAEFDARGYSSAETFLFEYHSLPLDCAIVDIKLGTMSGFDVARRLAAENSQLPIIFITAHDGPEAREEARQLGCVAYLRKPFPAQSLIDAIRSALPPKQPATAGIS